MYFWTRSHKRRVRTKRFNGTRLTVLRPYGSGSELQTIVENVSPLIFRVSPFSHFGDYGLVRQHILVTSVENSNLRKRTCCDDDFVTTKYKRWESGKKCHVKNYDTQ
jgi:hypothetical protein